MKKGSGQDSCRILCVGGDNNNLSALLIKKS